jgi:hypothetical protein|tara:strand:- start:1311 stop:1673 length:363 start_codon:yes stop_codon:yes gene_type:complete
MTKANFKSGDRVVFYHLQPIPRKDMKLSWIDNRPLSIYGFKRVAATIRQSHPSHNLLWVKPDDRAYIMTVKDHSVVYEEESEGSEEYIYLADIEKGHPLYFGGGCLLELGLERERGMVEA